MICADNAATTKMSRTTIDAMLPYKGKPVAEVLKLTNKAVTEALDGLPAHKVHCSVLAEQAVRAAVKDYYDHHGIAYDPGSFPDHVSCEG